MKLILFGGAESGQAVSEIKLIGEFEGEVVHVNKFDPDDGSLKSPYYFHAEPKS